MEYFNSLLNQVGAVGPLDFYSFLFRFILDFVVIYIIARQIYYRIHGNRDYLFTMVIINVIVFLVCYLLSSAQLTLGFAFGIFAVFSILRYRTMMVPIKEMTYIFISISAAILNSLAHTNVLMFYSVISQFALIALIIKLEKSWVKSEVSKPVVYEKIELIKPERRSEMLADLTDRTGLNVHRVDIENIDFMRDVALINIFYYNDK